MGNINKAIIYQAKNGQIEFRSDFEKDTVWASLNQIADLFGVQKAAISKQLRNIYESKELTKKATVSILETVQTEGKRQIKREIEYYNLDAILSVGYRVNSKEATHFRQWANSVLKQHIVDGFTINKKRLNKNYNQFIEAVDNVKTLFANKEIQEITSVLELVKSFAHTWISLDAYDRETFPAEGTTKRSVSFATQELSKALQDLKHELLSKNQATEIFGRENKKDALASIVGNIFQSFDKKDLYPSIEDKATHLLYFIVKNHPFVDGNKRSGAFAFIWFLKKANALPKTFTPEALSALTILIAESDPKNKDKMIGLILLLLRPQNNQN